LRGFDSRRLHARWTPSSSIAFLRVIRGCVDDCVVSSLATELALAEFVGTVAVVTLVVVALARKRHILTLALVVAVVFGIVFANPFGIVAEPSTTNARALTPSSEADGSRHWLKVGGIPVAWFTPYDQPYPWAGLGENSPTSVLKLRYGFSFLPSTGASSVVAQCSNDIDVSCWRDRSDDYPLVHRDDGRRWFVVPLAQTLVPGSQGESAFPNVPHVYEVRLGIASWRGLVYWLFVGVALGVSARMSAVRLRPVFLAAAGCLAAGVLVGAVMAAGSASPRSAASVSPPLLPEPAEAPESSGSVLPTPIESYEPSCIVRASGVAANRCGRIDALTASTVPGGILAVWTAEADGLMQLRARRLSSGGEPRGDASTLLRSWDQSANPGGWNCAIPAELQAAPLADGNVLVAWSSTCDLHPSSSPASITGLVLSPSGGVVRAPFPMLAYDRGLTAEPAPRYWLRTTTTGDAVLFWEAPSRTPYHRALFASRLNAQQRAVDGTEILSEEQSIGSVAVACGRTCLVVDGNSDGISYRMLEADGRVLRDGPLLRGQTMPRSELVAATAGNGFYAGWIESDGANADGYLATFDLARLPAVQKVASHVPTGGGNRGVTPRPLGIATGRAPALMFQTATAAEDEFLLHVASSGALSTTTTDVRFTAPTVLGEVLVAIGGLWPSTPDEPVSVLVR
jgi:hypothetical protein